MSSGTVDKIKGRAKENRAAQCRVGRLLVLAWATAFLGLVPRASRAQNECLLEIHDQSGSVPDQGTVCALASPKFCIFNLQLCLNQPGCTPATFKKKIHATGHCNPAKLMITPPSQSPCGDFAGIKVRTKKNGRSAGSCKIRVAAKSSDRPARKDIDKITLVCMPAGSACPAVTTTTTSPQGTTTTTIGGGQAPVALGSAANFAVLAGSTVTNTGATTVTGDLGVSPGTAVTGFPPGTVNGTTHAGDPAAAQAQLDLTTAYNDAAGRSVGAVTVAGNLGGQTLTPGLYKSTSSLEISSGDLTLDAQGDANAVFIFQMASTLTTTAGRQVILSGGAKAANVFWQVGSSATLGTTSVFAGNILAAQSITLNTGATLDGRALARIAAVALDTNTITEPAP